MADRYAKFQKTATRLIGKWKQGRVTVVRNVGGDPMPPGWPTWEVWPDNSRVEIYELDAVVKGVSAKLIDGNVVIASDLEVVCSNRMALVEVDGVSVSPQQKPFDVGLIETLSIDGRPVTIVRAMPTPAAGVKVVHRFIVR